MCRLEAADITLAQLITLVLRGSARQITWDLRPDCVKDKSTWEMKGLCKQTKPHWLIRVVPSCSIAGSTESWACSIVDYVINATMGGLEAAEEGAVGCVDNSIGLEAGNVAAVEGHLGQ